MNPNIASSCNVITSNRLLSAGTGEQSIVKAQVVNVYGQPLQNKTVNFSISVGDGSLAPVTDITDSNGESHTTYTVGTAVTTSTITAVVNI